MKHLIKVYNDIVFKKINKPTFEHLKIVFENHCINFKHVISEMNDNVYPIPKEVLSFFVKQIYENGYQFIYCYSMKFVYELTKKSSNLEQVKFNIKNLELAKDKALLFICLPYDLNVWLTELKKYFNEESIKQMFKNFNNAPGVQGTYVNGYLIIINSDYLTEIKDIEEITEHEFVHLFEDIDKSTQDQLSFKLKQLLQDAAEYKTFKINLLNRLDKIQNKYFIEHSITNTQENRYKFLEKMFELANNIEDEELFIDEIQKYDNSALLESNMLFFFYMVNAKPKEFDQWKNEIYEHFTY